MVIEVNDAGEILVPAALVQAPPHTRIEAGREGDAVVLKPVATKSVRKIGIGSLPVLEGRLSDSMMTFRREDIYGSDGR